MMRRLRHVFVALSAAGMSFWTQTAVPLGRQAPDVLLLVPGVPVSRELLRRAEHRYAVALNEGQLAHLVIEQDGSDVAAVVRAGNERVLGEFDEETGLGGREQVDVVAEARGTYVVTVKAAPGVSRPGACVIRLEAPRAATRVERAIQRSRTLQADAAVLETSGRFDAARAALERALAAADSTCGDADLLVAALAEQLGGVYRKLPDAARSEAFYRRAIAIDEAVLGARHPRTARARSGLALLYERQGDRAGAEALLQPALADLEKTLGRTHPWYVAALATLGNLRDGAGDLADEERIIHRGLAALDAIDEAGSVQYAALLNNLGEVYRQKRDYVRAEAVLLRALALDDTLLGPGNYASATPLQNLAIVAREQRNYLDAIAYNTRALSIREQAVGPHHPDVAHILTNLANIYRATGDMPRALETHFRALRIWETAAGPYQQATLLSVGNIARTYAAAGDVAHAIEYQRRSDAIVEKELALNLAVGSERQKLLFARSVAERTDRTVSLHLEQAPRDPAAASLAALALLQRKGRVLDAMIDTFTSVRRLSDPNDRARLDELRQTTSQLAARALATPSAARGDDRAAAVDRLEARKEQLEAELSAHSAEFRSHVQPVTLAAVQAAIPPDAALLEFAIFRPFDPRAERNADAYGPPRYAVYVVRGSGTPHGVDLGPAAAIDAAIDGFLGALRDPGRADVKVRARALHELVVQPLQSSVAGSRRLLVSPDGQLNLVPFEALVDARGAYLIHEYAISYLTSGRDLLRMQVPRRGGGPPVIVADPLFGESAPARGPRPAAYFTPLAATAEEGRAIAALFPDAALLTGRLATKAALLRIQAPRILHIASHGFFRQDAARDALPNPLLRSGLALAGANLPRDTADDGILTALEASGLNLWGTKLVTLSACDTALGEVENGEGVYGLRRAFVLAGSETQVMSLWPVSDAVSRETMVGYYTALRAGLGRGDALRQAKLALLERAGRHHPYYWASFTQSGEWGSLDGRR